MKLQLVLSAAILVCICACKKEAATPEPIVPTPQVASVDYRDSVTGSYYGTQTQCSRSGYPNITTTYTTTACTLQVIKDTASTDQIILVGFPWHFTEIPEKILPNDTMLYRVQTTLPIDRGNFSLSSPYQLTFRYGHQGMTGGTDYSYALTKQ